MVMLTMVVHGNDDNGDDVHGDDDNGEDDGNKNGIVIIVIHVVLNC